MTPPPAESFIFHRKEIKYTVFQSTDIVSVRLCSRYRDSVAGVNAGSYREIVWIVQHVGQEAEPR